MQSIVERATPHGVILGTFFFSRTDSTRNYAEVLIPTLAYQLASSFPEAMSVLDPIIYGKPLIFKSSLETQASELLVRPILHLLDIGVIDSTSRHRIVFLIDGLDECEDPKNKKMKQALIIRVITSVLCNHNLPVSFLIASRPEMAISQAMQREIRLHAIMQTVSLDNNDEATADILQFIKHSFLDIRESHPLHIHIPTDWPLVDSVTLFVPKSSGHFIYAAVAMKFISSWDENPMGALRVIEGLEPSRTGNPFTELDALYSYIISASPHKSQVLSILTHCLNRVLPSSVPALCFFNPEFSPEDVALFLSNLHGLVSILPDEQAHMQISLRHASLADFLLDKCRSEVLCVDDNDHGQYIVSATSRYFSMMDLDPEEAALTLMPAHGSLEGLMKGMMITWRDALWRQPENRFLYSLVNKHSPREVWLLASQCQSNWHETPASCRSEDQPAIGLAVHWVGQYLFAIRNSVRWPV